MGRGISALCRVEHQGAVELSNVWHNSVSVSQKNVAQLHRALQTVAQSVQCSAEVAAWFRKGCSEGQ